MPVSIQMRENRIAPGQHAVHTNVSEMTDSTENENNNQSENSNKKNMNNDEASRTEDESDSESIEGRTQDEFEDLEVADQSKFANLISRISSMTKKMMSSKYFKYVMYAILAAAFVVYVAFCIVNFIQTQHLPNNSNYESDIRLFWVSALIVLIIVGSTISHHFSDKLNDFQSKFGEFAEKSQVKFGKKIRYFVIIMQVFVIIGILIWVAITSPENLISAAGLLCLIFIALLCSRNIVMIDVRLVAGGVMLQLLFAILVLRTQFGFEIFNFLGDRVSEFLVHCDSGSSFVFGPGFREHFFAFSVLPVIIYFSAAVSILFHFGILQFLIEKIGLFMKFVMGTGAAESTVAAANIFIGQSEAPLIIAPYLKAMTNSEIHSIMTSGFATIAGSVLAAYVGMGVSAKHLIGASVMSAPAALAVSKIMFPETKKAVIVASKIRKIKLEKYSNIVEAAGAGAMSSVNMVACIAANLIAFISLLTFVNSTLTWMGHRAGFTVDITFELISSYALWPLSFVMGVPQIDCKSVAQLIGVKTFINEFVAYERFSNMNNNYPILMNLTNNGTLKYEWIANDIFIPHLNVTLIDGTLFEEKSKLIATYALCGFANLSSIGILSGALIAISPFRRHDIINCIITAMIAGNIACFMTACIAGLLYME